MRGKKYYCCKYPEIIPKKLNNHTLGQSDSCLIKNNSLDTSAI